MGGCSSRAATIETVAPTREDLQCAAEDDIRRLEEKGHIPCVAVPAPDDMKHKNKLSSFYFAEYENGTELTLLFQDAIESPRTIETVIIMNDNVVVFPGNHSGDDNDNWECENPQRQPSNDEAKIELNKFERTPDDTKCPIVWVNAWKNNVMLLGQKNNNTNRMIMYYRRCPEKASIMEQTDRSFSVKKGSRSEVDKLFSTTAAATNILTAERQTALGKRIG